MAVYTLRELAADSQIHWDYWPLQKRVALLFEDERFQGVSSKWVNKSGRHGAWNVTEAGRTILVRLQEIESGGVSIEAAFQILHEELTASRPVEAREPAEPFGDAEAAILRTRLEAAKEECDALRVQRNDLQVERDRLLGILESMTLALPKPKRADRPGTKQRFVDRLFRRRDG